MLQKLWSALLFYPALTTAIPFLCGCPETLISKLQSVQNHAARLVLKARKSDHITPLLRSLHWLPVKYRMQYKTLSLCYSSLTGSSPSYLSDLLHTYVPARQLRSSSDPLILRIPNANTKSYGERTFSFQAPHLWNSLPKNIRHSESITTFKASLKTYLFRKAFPDK